MRRPLLIIALILAAGSVAFGDQTGAASGQFLNLAGETRGAAMGSAYTAAADDVAGLWYNPATINRAKQGTASFIHVAHVEGMTFNSLAGTSPLPRGQAIGLGLSMFQVGSISSYDQTGAAAGAFSPKDMALTAAYAKAFRETRVGLALKYVSSTIDEAATTAAWDLGLHQTLGEWAVGLSALNQGGSLSYGKESYPLPRKFRLGTSWQPRDAWLLNLDLVRPNDGSLFGAFGTEYGLRLGDTGRLALRAGYSTENSGDVEGLHGLTAGMGFRLAALDIDYAWIPYGDLGMSHRLGLKYKFKSPLWNEDRRVSFIYQSERKEKKKWFKADKTAAPLPESPWTKPNLGERTSPDNILAAFSPSNACPSFGPQAMIVHIKGRVEVTRDPEQTEWRLARKNGYLFGGDAVRTQPQSSVQIKFANGAVVELGPDSKFSVDSSETPCEKPAGKIEAGEMHAAPSPEKWVESGPTRWNKDKMASLKESLASIRDMKGVTVSEYMRDKKQRDELMQSVGKLEIRRIEMLEQINDFKSDITTFAELKKSLAAAGIPDTRELRRDLYNQDRQAENGLTRAKSQLSLLSLSLKKLMSDLRDQQQELAKIPHVGLVNITAKESTIPFGTGASVITEDIFPLLDKLAESIKEMRPLKIVIEGHTDRVGIAKANKKLSRKRAAAVMKYLRIQTGLPGGLFEVRGRGSEEPLDTGESEESFAKNRRVEIWIELEGEPRR